MVKEGNGRGWEPFWWKVFLGPTDPLREARLLQEPVPRRAGNKALQSLPPQPSFLSTSFLSRWEKMCSRCSFPSPPSARLQALQEEVDEWKWLMVRKSEYKLPPVWIGHDVGSFPVFRPTPAADPRSRSPLSLPSLPSSPSRAFGRADRPRRSSGTHPSPPPGPPKGEDP